MTTVSQRIGESAEQLKVDAALLLRHSRIQARQDDGSRVVVLGCDNTWLPLPVEGVRIQSHLHDCHNRFLALLTCLLRNQKSAQTELRDTTAVILEVIQQEGWTATESVEVALAEFKLAIDRQVRLLAGLYDGAEGRHLYVPDTNALLHNPKLEDWAFDGVNRFELVLIPTVLSELDQLKVSGREAVQKKAEQIVRQLFEYRRRGSLDQGVVLRRDSHSIRSLAAEPDFENTLPWLNDANNDDRILATFIEVMRQHPRCHVTLVSRDINLANKADMARLPCVQPPEPSSA